MPVNLASFELKLLVVFDAVLAEGSVSRAAERLGMSQPAVSNALNRLRTLLNDRLFVRTGEGMRPTPRARDLAEPIQAAMRRLEAALEPVTFEPVEANWTFTLAISDHASVVLLPQLLRHMAAVAPRVGLSIQSRRSDELVGVLDGNEVDVAVGIIPDLPARFGRAALFEDTYLCMMRRDHPLAGRPLTLAEFQSVDQLAIKPGSSDVSRADRLLARQGVRRRTVTSLHQFLAAPAIVSHSDLVVLVFERMIPIFDPSRFYFCPVPAPGMAVSVSAVWGRVHNERPAHRWFRRQLTLVARTLGDAAAPAPGEAIGGLGARARLA